MSRSNSTACALRPRPSRSRAVRSSARRSGERSVMPVRPRTRMASRVEWITAQRTGGTSRLDEAHSLNGERPRLFASARDPRRLARFVLARRLLGEDHDAIGARVVGDGERANDKVRLVELLETELFVARELARARKVLEHLAEMARDGCNLLLFELQRDEVLSFTCLQHEDALADRTDCAERDPSWLPELVEAHASPDLAPRPRERRALGAVC